MKAPLVSICIPCHNAARFVEAAVSSALDQSWPSLEVIVVDDNSSDGSRSILSRIQDPRVSVLHRHYGSAAAARNEAFRHSTGNLIKFFDADDLLSPGLVEQQVLRLNGSEDSIATCEWGRFYSDDPETYRPNPEEVWMDLPADEWLVRAWKNARPMMQPGIFLLPRSLMDRAGPWDESLSLIDDFEFFARILSQAKNVVFTPGERLLYRSGLTDSLSQRTSAKAVESAARSLIHGTGHLLSRRTDEEAKRSCANLLQDFVYTYYPRHRQLREEMDRRVTELGGSDLSPDGPPNFQRLRRLTGWKAARRIQRLAGR